MTATSSQLPPSIAPDKDIAEPRNPYKGLQAFREADAGDFFGREGLTDRLIQRLGDAGQPSRFLAVVGPSGSGKSSLVKAGLIPALRHGAISRSDRWLVIDILPGTHPLEQLEIALIRVAAGQAGNIHDQLQEGERGLLRAAQLLLPDDDSQLLLVIDQFEEVFTLVEDEQARVHFLNNLVTAVSDSRSQIHIIVTLRADFFDRPLRYVRFGELVRRNVEIVLPLTADELERAIVRPAEQVGVTFEAGLVASIMDEVHHQPGALPLLEYTLTELFERRSGRTVTQLSYRAIGGTVGALAQSADDLYEHFEANAREAARQMFLRLVTLGEGVEDTRRRVPREELLAIATDPTVMSHVIDTFTACRLLSLGNDPTTHSPMVEVAHEAILREWERVRAWLNEARTDIRLQRQLAHAANEWYRAQQDASFLLRGSRLEQLEEWARTTALALTPDERVYVAVSVAERQRQESAEHERRRQETALERRSRNTLRVLVVVLLVATLGTLALAGLAVNQSQVARQNAVIADHNAAESQNVALVSGSQAALANGNTDQAIALALQAVTLNPLSAEAQAALSQAAYSPGTVRVMVGHTDEVSSAVFSPDGKTALSAGYDNTLILWDLATGTIIRRFIGHRDKVWRVAFSSDGRTAVSASQDKTIILWNVASGAIIRRFTGHSDAVNDAVFSPDDQTIISCSSDKTLILWDAATGNIIRRFTGHTAAVNTIAISPDGHTVLSASDDQTLILWDVATSQIVRHFGANGEGHNDHVLSVAISPDGRTAVSGSGDLTMILWDITTGQVIRRFYGHRGDVSAVAFSPDGRTALSGSGDGTLILWNLATSQIISQLHGHKNYVHHVAFSPDGRYALSASEDNTVRLWDLEGGQVVRQFAGHKSWVWGMAVSPDGRYALSCSDDGTAILWDVQTGQELRRIDVKSPLSSVAFSPDSHTALIAMGFFPDMPSDVILWDVETGQEIRRFVGHPHGIVDVAYSPDGRTAVSSGEGGIIILWNVATGQEIRRFHGHETKDLDISGGADSSAFSPDGQTILSVFGDGTIILWNVATGQEIHRFVGHKGVVNNGVFSPDGQTALSGAWDNTAILWDVATGAVLYRFTDHSAAVFRTFFSPDGQSGFAGSGDNTSTLWDLKTGQVIRRYSGGVWRAAFSTDGRSAVVGYTDGRVELWRIDSSLDELLAWTYANRYVPALTCEQRTHYRLEPACDVNGSETTSTPQTS